MQRDLVDVWTIWVLNGSINKIYRQIPTSLDCHRSQNWPPYLFDPHHAPVGWLHDWHGLRQKLPNDGRYAYTPRSTRSWFLPELCLSFEYLGKFAPSDEYSDEIPSLTPIAKLVHQM
jgi:hypothetical protein